jgi:hypothetical protein
MSKSKFRLTTALAAIMLSCAQANAAIIVEGTDYWNSTSSPVNGNFDARGSDKLVVIVTGEHGFNQTANGQINDVTYDGVSLTKLVDRNPIHYAAGPPEVLVDDTANDIWYLDDPGSVYSAGLISVNATTRGNVTVFGLSGTATGAGNTVIGPRDSNSADLVTSAGSIVIASYGLGGSGNTAQLSGRSWNGDVQVSAQENGSNWDGHITGYSLNVAAGNATYSFTDTNPPGGDGRTGAHVIAAEFLEGPPPPVLTLQVDTVTGRTALIDDDLAAVDINYYEVTSSGGLSLDDTTWYSLTDQDFEGNGPPNGSGNGWEEAGGAGPHGLAEGYLLGNSTIAVDASIALGYGYDESVNAQDLTFKYRNSLGKIITGDIDYVTSLLGDFDGDDDVDIDDIDALTLVGDLSAGVAVTPANAQFDLNSDYVIDSADLDQWLAVAATTNGFGSPYLRGDANLDGDVDVFQIDGGGDAQILSSNLGTPSGAAWSNGDFNADGDVDVFQIDGGGDAQLLSSNLGSSSDIGGASIVAVPEPTSLVLFALAGIAMLGRRR